MVGLSVLFDARRENVYKVVFAVVSIICAQVALRLMLGYSGWSHIARESIASFLLCFIILTFLGRKFLAFYLVVLFLVGFSYGVVGLTYGLPDRNAIEIFMLTDGGEAVEFLRRVPPYVFAYYCVFILLFMNALHWVFVLPDIRMSRGVCLILVFLLIAISLSSVIRTYFGGESFSWKDVRLTEVSFPMRIYSDYKFNKEFDEERSRGYGTSTVKVSPIPNQEQCEVCVFVMGESVRADFMEVYGAPWNNTPWMQATPGVLFRNMYSAANATASSLSVALYSYDEEGKSPYSDNLISMANAAGYHTAWFSNQGARSKHDSPAAIVASYANESCFIKESLPLDGKQHKDIELLDNLKSVLDEDGKIFVVLHLEGSHPLACERTNGEMDEYFVSDELSCYIRSIRDTDYLLSKVSDLLKQKSNGRRWGIMYTADHGLDFSKNRHGLLLSHGGNFADAYRVPLFFVNSTSNLRQEIDSERSGRYLLYIVANWLGYRVEGDRYVTDCRWLDDVVCEDQDRVRRRSGPFFSIKTLPEYTLKNFLKNGFSLPN